MEELEAICCNNRKPLGLKVLRVRSLKVPRTRSNVSASESELGNSLKTQEKPLNMVNVQARDQRGVKIVLISIQMSSLNLDRY